MFKDVAETIKLNSIKQEARFAANAMMLKLTCHYEISKVIIKLTDVKRNKMIKFVHDLVFDIFYVLDLKPKP